MRWLPRPIYGEASLVSIAFPRGRSSARPRPVLRGLRRVALALVVRRQRLVRAAVLGVVAQRQPQAAQPLALVAQAQEDRPHLAQHAGPRAGPAGLLLQLADAVLVAADALEALPQRRRLLGV